MGQKNKTRSASAPARKTKSSKLKTRPAPRKAPAKKAKPDEAALAVLNADKLKQLYATMLKCRMLTERMGGIVDSGSNPAHILPGLEAMLVGAGAHLQPQDSIALEHGGFLARLIKGTPLRVILAQMNEPQKSNGIQQRSTNDGTATSHTMMTGLALAQEMKGKGAVTLMFATNNSSTSDFEPDAMALAATQKLPIVCLVEGRFDARAESHILPIPSDSHGVGSGYYPKITVDGCDVVAVFRVAQEAVRRARQGHGPALIECMTARENALVGGAARYIAKDALKFMEQYLRKKKLWSADWRRRIATAFAKELEAAFTQANMQPPPGSDFDHVYTPENHGASQPAKSHPPQVTAAPAL